MTTTSTAGRAFAPYTPPAPPSPSIRPAVRPRRVYPTWLAPAIVGSIVLAVAIGTMSPWPVGVYYDDGIYVVLAKALASGEGYRYLNLPGHPAATHYPPGYPAFLALLWRLWPAFPANVALFKLANAVLLGVAAAGLFVFARRKLELPTLVAAPAVLLGCLTVPVLAVTGVLFSEPLFLVALAATLIVGERAIRDGRPGTALIAGALAGATTLVRTLGLPLVAALVVVLFMKGRRKSATIAAVAAAAFVLPWHLWTASNADALPRVVAGSYGSYAATYAATIRERGIAHAGRIAVHNVRDLARPTGAVFGPGTRPVMRGIVVAGAVGLLALGAIMVARSSLLLLLFLAGYAAIVIAWPFAPDRFLWGVWPLLLLVFAAGGIEAMRGMSTPATLRLPVAVNAAATLTLALMCFGLVRYNVRGYREQWWDAAQRAVARQAVPLAEWVSSNTRPMDVIASDNDPLIHLYTGRYVVPSSRWAAEAYPAAPDSASRVADLVAFLSSYPIRYVLISGFASPSARASTRLADGPHPRLQLLTTTPAGGGIFAVTPAARTP